MNVKEYANYRQTAQWKEKRKTCLEKYDHRCQVCGCTSWRRIVDVHHLHYKNIGKENPEDLISLCCVHHEMIHNQADGFDEKILRRLQRECEESHWDDPLPADVRHRQLNLRDGFERAYPDVICPKCHTKYRFTEDNPYCEGCGYGIRPTVKPQTLEQRNADTLGFTEARLFYETRNCWTKVGGIRRNPKATS